MPNIISPFPPDSTENLYDWLQEFPSSNFDDYGPATLEDFKIEMQRRSQVEHSWGIYDDQGELCGAVSILPLTSRLCITHGICFAKGHLTREQKREAMRQIIAELFAHGIEKIQAQFFASNQKIATFFKDLGFNREGYFASHTVQHGKPVDMVVMALIRKVG